MSERVVFQHGSRRSRASVAFWPSPRHVNQKALWHLMGWYVKCLKVTLSDWGTYIHTIWYCLTVNTLATTHLIKMQMPVLNHLNHSLIYILSYILCHLFYSLLIQPAIKPTPSNTAPPSLWKHWITVPPHYGQHYYYCPPHPPTILGMTMLTWLTWYLVNRT